MTESSLLLDAHAHPHVTHDPAKLLDSLVGQARRLAPESHVGMVLLDGDGMAPWMETWCARGGTAPEGWELRVTDAARGVVDASGAATKHLRIYAGRQIVCLEKLEVLALLVDRSDVIPSGLPLSRTIEKVHAAGGLPILAWGVGKWFGGRGRTVRRWVSEALPGSLALGDTALRPIGWPEPAPMRAARRRGIPVLPGSDPLSRSGDECMAGSYASLIPLESDSPPDAAGLMDLIASPDTGIRPIGRRNTLPRFILRQLYALRAGQRR